MNTGKYNYKTICNYIIGYCQVNDNAITNLQLQKILYYVQGYFLKNYGYPAFDAEIEAWQYGPVVPEAYYDFCINGRKSLKVNIPENAVNEITYNPEKKIINKIIEKCINLNIGTLVDKTHEESPWKDAKELKSLISVDKIYDFFTDNDPLGIGV